VGFAGDSADSAFEDIRAAISQRMKRIVPGCLFHFFVIVVFIRIASRVVELNYGPLGIWDQGVLHTGRIFIR